MATTHEPLKKRLKKRRARQDDSGAHALLDARHRATLPQACGTHSIAHMLSQERTPQRQHPPVRLQHPHRHPIRLADPSLEAYEAFVITRHTA